MSYQSINIKLCKFVRERARRSSALDQQSENAKLNLSAYRLFSRGGHHGGGCVGSTASTGMIKSNNA